MRSVVEVGQGIQKPGRRISRDPAGEGVGRRLQEQCIGACRLETSRVERQRKILREQTFVNANRAIELIIVQKAATTAGRQRRVVAKRCQRTGQAVVEPANTALEQEVAARAKARTG